MIKPIGIWAALLITAMGWSACTPALPRHPARLGVTYKGKVDIPFNGFRRTYRVHLPPAYDQQRPLPLVVVIHGAFDTAKGIERFSGFSKLADQENFVAAYPNGIGLLGFLQHWNAGHCCGKAAADNIDDVDFIKTVIRDLCSRLAVDRRRIYMTGFSNGGMMAYRFAAEQADMLAAVAPLAASIGGRPSKSAAEWSIPTPSRPLPVLAIHGLADQYVPFWGGVSPARGGEREYWSVQRSLDFWVQYNGCRARSVKQKQRQGKVIMTTWQQCRDDVEVILYALEGWGHIWPGPYFTADLPPSDSLYNFDAAAVVWDFFKRWQR